MFSKVVRGAWYVHLNERCMYCHRSHQYDRTAETAGGGPSSSRYATNPLYEIQVDTATQLM